ncbi:Methylthioribose kinase [Seminavis robusta]|uniref:Methylthioribose kinase n=1 Tax=Seminavis robusta TaxID=568900 RepID=A0A9N8HVH3_9STRA|nr:Methylthioribose kinase [Seminavis robusta]|eukprot:Sro1946_g307030.1 Methylthioribose kinase (397) ;mRNA; r:8879-10159
MTVVTDAKILTVDTVPTYLASSHSDKLESIFGCGSPKLTAKAIQGGNVNYAFCVTDEASSKTVFLKQAPEFVAIFGPDGFPLTSARMQQEMDVYAEWKTLLGDELATRYLPKIHFFDKSYMVVVMEFLEGYELLDHVLVSEECNVHANVATYLGDFMGRTHAATHSSKVDAERKAYLVDHYENRAMRDIQLEFVFTKCFKEATDEQRAGLTLTPEFMEQVEMMKQQYDGKTDSLVLSHGDIHPGSVMVNCKDGETKVIDPEFTVYGPPGLDVGSLLSGFVLGAIHQAFSNNPKAVEAIVEGTKAVWGAYVKAMKDGGISDDIIKSIEIETVGFTLQEVCRTALEFAGGRKWLQFEDPDTKLAAKKAALAVVDKCMIARHEGGMPLLLKEMQAVATK